MSLRYRRIAVLLAAVVALRALVPLGYMLERGGEHLFDLALALCPQQNPALDLNRLGGHHSGVHAHHAHHAPASADDVQSGLPPADTATGIDTTCQLWSGSSTAVAVTTAIVARYGFRAAQRPRRNDDTIIVRRARTVGARAPPNALIV